MKRSVRYLGLSLIAAALFAVPAVAQESSVLSSAEIGAIVSNRAAEHSENRSALRAFLKRPAVRNAATSAGVDIRDVRSAAATLSDEEVGRLRPLINNAEAAIGGGLVITISILGIILIIVLILIL